MAVKHQSNDFCVRGISFFVHLMLYLGSLPPSSSHFMFALQIQSTFPQVNCLITQTHLNAQTETQSFRFHILLFQITLL